MLGTLAGEQVLDHRRSRPGQMQTRAEEQLCPSANDVIWKEGVLRHERLRNESASAKVLGQIFNDGAIDSAVPRSFITLLSAVPSTNSRRP